jgi:3-oxoacyl-[acyl-carrier protein] reductase
MKARGRGSIVNISSGAGRSHSLTGIQAYASAKAGLIGLTRQTARELGPHGIRVNCVAPGLLRSNPASERQWQAMGEAGQRQLLDSIALRRLGQADEIARVVRFFASDDAAYVTGQTISADGGIWMLG